jgi:tRNA threonylcarbamoyladenosine biosynthesis protein TsaE
MELALTQIDRFINQLKELIDNKNIVVILQGDLASGKTTLVKEYVKSCKIDESVTSPTFMVQSVYADCIYHYDIYNKELENFIATGLLEEFEKNGIHFVEWGDDKLINILNEYGFEYLVIKILKKENKREYIIGS